jgi:hypothetical protein
MKGLFAILIWTDAIMKWVSGITVCDGDINEGYKEQKLLLIA